jgi:D-sedoheptulose 7-phosphate isomerase
VSAIKSHFEESLAVLQAFLADDANFERIEKAGNLMVDAIRSKGKVISCGNGGSMADAMHFAEEMTGRFRDDRKALPAISISDPTHLSCVSNDYGYEHVFSRFVEAIGNDGDVLLAISTSGNSENVVRAAKVALEKGMKVVALTGKDGGQLAALADVEIRAPKSQYADRVQEIHIKVIHSLIDHIERNV